MMSAEEDDTFDIDIYGDEEQQIDFGEGNGEDYGYEGAYDEAGADQLDGSAAQGDSEAAPTAVKAEDVKVSYFREAWNWPFPLENLPFDPD